MEVPASWEAVPFNTYREVMKMEILKINYLCRSWQGLIQQLVYLVSRGYYHYCLIEYPLQKKEKWEKIDLKLINKYQCNKSKFQRARSKNKGNTNFYFIRYENAALILHTNGELLKNIAKDDIFHDCRNKKTRITIPIKTITLTIMPPGDPNHNGVTVRLSKESYRGMKEHLKSVCQGQNRQIVIKEFNKLNGIPAWSGIIKQKKMLAEYTISQARKNFILIKKEDLRLNTSRKPYKVWKE